MLKSTLQFRDLSATFGPRPALFLYFCFFFCCITHQDARSAPLGRTLPRGRFDTVNLPHVSLHQQPLGEQLSAVLALVGPLLLVFGQHVLP